MVNRRGLKFVALVLVMCLMVCALAACKTTLSGTYVNKGVLLEQRMTFKDDNKVAVSAFGIEIEGDYVIEDGTITITYTLLGLSYDWVKSFEKNGDTIIVDGTAFVKEK